MCPQLLFSAAVRSLPLPNMRLPHPPHAAVFTGVATAVIAVTSKSILSPLGLAHAVITGVGMAIYYGWSLFALKPSKA